MIARSALDVICDVLRSARIESPFPETEIAASILHAFDLADLRVASRAALARERSADGSEPKRQENLIYSIDVFDLNDNLIEVLARLADLASHAQHLPERQSVRRKS